jgi:VWFA-related protein
MTPLRWLAAVWIVAAPAVLAQPAPQGAKPVFRSGLDLVRLDVRVTDGDGLPITDLRPEELTLTEEGSQRPILLFQRVEAPRGTYADAAQRTISAQVSTNQGSPRGHVYVLVFDESHILPGHEQRARVAAERFLRTRLRPGDRVALYALPGPGPQIEFTADSRRVINQLIAVRGAGEEMGAGSALTPVAPMRIYEAYEIARGNQKVLDRVTNEVSENLPGSDTRTAARTTGGAGAALAADYEDNRRSLIEDARSMVARADGESRRFLLALADVVRTLRNVDGRKAVILFSEGFQIDHVTHELEEVAAAAAQSYSVIYAMDLNSRAIEATDQTPRGGEQSTETLDKLQSLGSLAAQTSGTLVTDAAAQIDRALARVAETSEDYYLVGFTPADGGKGDRSRYRPIHVSVTRPGARVSARTGYSLNPGATPADRRRTIDAALRAPFAQEGLRVEYTTYVLRGSDAGHQRVVVSLASDLPIGSSGAEPADIIYVVRDVATGKVTSSGSDHIALPAAPRDAGATTGSGLYRVQFELPPGTYLMRAVVREPGGLLGSADRRFQVGAMSGPDVTASDLVLGSSDVNGLPVRAAAYSSDVLSGVFELYGRTAAQLEGLTVTTDLVPLAGGPTAVSSAAEIQPVQEQNGGPSRGVRIDLPLADVTPGQYLVRASVRRGHETITELLRDVSIRAGARPDAPEVAIAFVPLEVLRGDVARQLMTTLEARTRGGALEAAARAAAAGRWSSVETALPAATSESADALTLRGIAAFARAEYPAAIIALRAARDNSTGEPALSFVLGWAYAAAGDDRAAISAWRNAVVTDPRLVPPYLALADAYVRLGEPMLARQVVESGLRALPGSPELLNRLGRLRDR